MLPQLRESIAKEFIPFQSAKDLTAAKEATKEGCVALAAAITKAKELKAPQVNDWFTKLKGPGHITHKKNRIEWVVLKCLGHAVDDM